MLILSAQETGCNKEDSLVAQVVFNLGLPDSSNSTKIDHAKLKESIKTALAPCQISMAGSNMMNGNEINDKISSMFIQPAVSNGDAVFASDINCVSQTNKPTAAMPWDADGCLCRTESKVSSEQTNDVTNNVETLAETSLPWRRQTSLPPVSSSVCSSLPDDENPLMSEAPSWADNLAYSHLTETGSPYSSPQNTITCKPSEAFHRPVFELFPPHSPQPSNAVSSIPPPWTVKNKTEERQEDEPLPSQSVTGSDAGDKASCLLISSHDLVPPSYHSCLQPAVNGLDSFNSRRHSDVGSPIHFQLMQKPETLSVGDLESQLIGIEEDYHHGMADRVSQWLANSSNGDSYPVEIDCELASRVESQRILDSLRQKKKLELEDSDDGTNADDESDYDVFDTKL